MSNLLVLSVIFETCKLPTQFISIALKKQPEHSTKTCVQQKKESLIWNELTETISLKL